MPRWIIPAIVVAIVCARSAVFLLSPASYFDSDQAIVGLMAKHLSELGGVARIPGVYRCP